jgi:hypothetical protein
MDANDEYMSLVQSEEHDDAWSLNVFQEVQQYRTTIERAMHSTKQEATASVTSKDRRSQGSSGISRVSSEKRILEEQKKAELQVLKESLKKKQELAQKRLQLEMESEQIAIEEQLAVVEARTKVLDDLESVSTVRSLRDTLHHTQRWHQEVDCNEGRQQVPIVKPRCNYDLLDFPEQMLSS